MPEIPVQQPTSSKQNQVNWRRILVIVVTATTLIGLGVLIFLIFQPEQAKPTSSPTTYWKLYKNAKLGFSFKYLSNYNLNFGKSSQSELEMGIRSPDFGSFPNVIMSGGMLRLTVLSSENYDNNAMYKFSQKTNQRKFIVGGLEADRFDFKWDAYTYTSDYLILRKDKRVFVFWIAAEDDSREKVTKVFEEVFSSFKFLE